MPIFPPPIQGFIRLFTVPDNRYLQLVNNTGWKAKLVPRDWDGAIIDCTDVEFIQFQLYSTNQRPADLLEITLDATVLSADASGIMLEVTNDVINDAIAQLKNGAIQAEYVIIGRYHGNDQRTICIAQGTVTVNHKNPYDGV